MKRSFVPTAFCLLLAAPFVSMQSGCSSTSYHASRDATQPRPTTASHPATSTVGQNFETAKLAKLAVIIEGNPLYAKPSANAGYVWQGSLATGDWIPRAAINAQAITVARFVEDEFISVLLAKGYTVPTRSDVETALTELKFLDKTGYTERDAIQLGRILKATGIVIVSGLGQNNRFTYKHQEYTRIEMRVSARLIGVEKAEILWLGNKTYSGDVPSETIGIQWVGNLFKELADQIPKRE